MSTDSFDYDHLSQWPFHQRMAQIPAKIFRRKMQKTTWTNEEKYWRKRTTTTTTSRLKSLLTVAHPNAPSTIPSPISYANTVPYLLQPNPHDNRCVRQRDASHTMDPVVWPMVIMPNHLIILHVVSNHWSPATQSVYWPAQHPYHVPSMSLLTDHHWMPANFHAANANRPPNPLDRNYLVHYLWRQSLENLFYFCMKMKMKFNVNVNGRHTKCRKIKIFHFGK